MSSLDNILEKQIKECEEVLEKNNHSEINALGSRLGELYFGEIKQITYLGQYNSYSTFGRKELEHIKDALILHRANKKYEIEVEKCKSHNVSLKSEHRSENPINLRDIGNIKDSGNSINTNSNVNMNNNTIDITTLFEKTKREIENNGSLTEEEIEEIIGKINEIELISQEEISRPKKWGKFKSVINWMTTKGVDIGVKIYPLIMSSLQNNSEYNIK